jgi:hypothetical protein
MTYQQPINIYHISTHLTSSATSSFMVKKLQNNLSNSYDKKTLTYACIIDKKIYMIYKL